MFDKLVAKLVEQYLELNPVMATSLGLHEYDSLAPRLDKRWYDTAYMLVDEALEKLKEIDPGKLTGERRVDYKVLVNSLKLTKREFMEWPTHRMMPQGLLVFGELFTPILTRSYLPRDHVLHALESRLIRVEDVVLASFEVVDQPYQLWIDMVLQVAEGSRILVEIVKAYGERYGRDWSREAEEAMDKLAKAVEEAEKLREKAKPGFKPIGRELFAERLKLSFIHESPEELRQHGYREAEKYRGMMMKVAEEIGAKSIPEALARIKERRPSSAEEVFQLHEKALQMTRSFIIEKQIIDLPVGEYVEVIETPPHLRPLMPFAGYIPPETFHYSSMGLYLVTKPETPEMLSHFNWYDILNTTVHEAYPGHHVQLCYAKNAPTILRKAYFNPPDFIEGWAHYTEWLMLEEGIDNSPEYKLKVLHDALWRAVRVYVDVELSTGMIGFEEAVKKLMEDAYLPRQGAIGEALRYTITPGYQLSYNYGKTKILELREKAKKLLGPKYSHRLFHKLLLEEGNLPVNVLSEIVLEKIRRYVKT